MADVVAPVLQRYVNEPVPPLAVMVAEPVEEPQGVDIVFTVPVIAGGCVIVTITVPVHTPSFTVTV